ncbi:MAG: hypothetical protein ACRDGS_05870, partial [Chloroflexota bacterium]
MKSRAFKSAPQAGSSHSRRLIGAAAIGAMLTIAAIGPARLPGSVARAAGGAGAATATCAGSDKAPAGTTVSIAFSSTQEFNVNAQAAQWFAMLKKQFEAAHPGVTVKLIPIGGSYND